MPNVERPDSGDFPAVEYHTPPAPAASYDPLRYCVMTTVALLAWLLGPAVVVAMSVLGLWAYGSAIRGGLTRSRCVLRRPALVLCYLGIICLTALSVVVRAVAR